MKNKFDFKDLMSFGMFLLALLTFIYLHITIMIKIAHTIIMINGKPQSGKRKMMSFLLSSGLQPKAEQYTENATQIRHTESGV